MFFICPLLQHLLCCPDMLHSPKSWEKNRPHPKSCKGFYLQNQPWSTFTTGRQRQQHEAMRSIQSSSPQKTSLCPINFFFLLTPSTSFIVLHICHILPWWSFPGLKILVYWISPYNTAVPYPRNCSTWVLPF